MAVEDNPKNSFMSVFEKEGAAFLWSFFYFFSLLTAYFILRPIRDAMGIAGGTGSLAYLFSYTFFVMLAVMPVYGALVARFPRRKLIPYIYSFFIFNLIVGTGSLALPYGWNSAGLVWLLMDFVQFVLGFLIVF